MSQAGSGVRVLRRTPRKLAQERIAYERWVPHLEGCAPALLEVREDPPGLVVTELPGVPATALAPDWPHLAEVHREAGRILARLHAIGEADRDPVPVQDALLLRLEAVHRRARGTDAEPIAVEAERRVRLESAQPLVRVPCHRDFEPRNWLVRPGPPVSVAVVDFEHARMDLALADLTRLRGLVWPDRPDLAAAFWRGYGGPPSAEDARLLTALTWLDAAATWSWGLAHADPEFIARGRHVAAALRARADGQRKR